ncbi:MAG TPA: glycosyltransferase family 87 protein [Tepidisphaeraceae bacterium]|nr:glycosyltransferase family 87 protein [Tepidisphaeraceae bacterium]
MDFKEDDPSTQIVARRLCAAFWLVLAGISLAAFLGTVNDVMESPGTDLRCRVVGARAMMLGMDPYFMPAKTDQVQTLQDPDRYAAVCTRCTYAPTLLCLYMPFANLSYQAQRYIWFGIEWCALAGSIVLLRETLRGRLIKNVFTAIATFFFADGVFWRLHLERGQYYVFIVFLLSLTAWFCIGKSGDEETPTARDHWWNGIPLGIAAAMRLTPLAALLPLWVSGFRRTAVGAAVVFGACIAGALAVAGPGPWESYFRSVSIQSRLVLDSDFFNSERAKLPPLPATAEGMTFKQRIAMPCANVTFAMDILQPMSDRFHWMPGRDQWQLISRGGAAVVCLLFPLALRRRTLGPAEKLAAVFLCVLSVDFFLPARISYADILFLAPIALLMPSMLRDRKGFIWLAVTLLGLAMCHGMLPTQLPISLLRPPLLMLGLLAYLAVRWTDRPSPSPAQAVEVEELHARAA